MAEGLLERMRCSGRTLALPLVESKSGSNLCFCYPPAMHVCGRCSQRKARLEALVEDVALLCADSKDSGDAVAPPLLRQASLTSMQVPLADSSGDPRVP